MATSFRIAQRYNLSKIAS